MRRKHDGGNRSYRKGEKPHDRAFVNLAGEPGPSGDEPKTAPALDADPTPHISWGRQRLPKWEIERLGRACKWIAQALILTRPSHCRKHDRSDAIALAQQQRTGLLVTIRVPWKPRSRSGISCATARAFRVRASSPGPRPPTSFAVDGSSFEFAGSL